MTLARRWSGTFAVRVTGWTIVCVLSVMGAASCGSEPNRQVYNGLAFDRGPLEDRRQIVNLFRKLQDDFYAGRVDAFCSHFDVSNIYSTVLPGDCQKAAAPVAAALRRGQIDWPRFEMQWVRTYGPVGGLTVGSEGSQIRLGFHRVNGTWKADFKVPGQLEALNVE